MDGKAVARRQMLKRNAAGPRLEEELADRARISLRTLQRLEAGEAEAARVGVLYRVAWALGCRRLEEVIDERWLEWPSYLEGPTASSPPTG